MARCRTLIQENEELGKMVEQGRFGQLQNQLHVQTGQVTEMKVAQSGWGKILKLFFFVIFCRLRKQFGLPY